REPRALQRRGRCRRPARRPRPRHPPPGAVMSDLYQDRIVAQAKAATRAGRLEAPDATLTRDNPLCGDRITLDIRFDGKRIADLAHRVRGCLLCEAAASAIGAHAVGKTAADVAAAE